MKINGLILGQGQPITDGRTLKAMERAGHFILPDKGHPYVDNGNGPSAFTWNGRRYEIKYFSGCFFPFVVPNDLQS